MAAVLVARGPGIGVIERPTHTFLTVLTVNVRPELDVGRGADHRPLGAGSQAVNRRQRPLSSTEFPALERLHVGHRECEPLSTAALLGKSLVDAVWVVGPYGVNEFQVYGQCDRDLSRSLLNKVCRPDLESLLPAHPHDCEVDEAFLSFNALCGIFVFLPLLRRCCQ